MLTSADVVEVELGSPAGREAGFEHPAIIVTAQRVLRRDPAVVHVVPLTSVQRRFESEVVIAPDDHNGLDVVSSAQCQHIRAISTARVGRVRGNVGPTVLAQVRDTVAMLLDLPA